MNHAGSQSLILPWAIALMVIFPVLILVLGELIHRYQRRDRPLAATLVILRNLVVPVLALLLFMQKVLQLDLSSSLVKAVQTLFWVCLIHASLSLLNVILFEQAQSNTWRSRVPKLLIDLLRLFLILVGSAIVLANVWNADLAGLATALGVSSIVIALALQDTLGSVMSGIALLFERPFSVGDWLKVGDIVGQVIDINWRAVRLQTLEREMIVIPHKLISGEMVRNFNQPVRLHAERFRVGFSYQDAPNLAKQILKSTAIATEGVLNDPEPQVFTISYDDFAITYEVKFFIEDYAQLEEIRDRFVTRVWYAAQRNQLVIPFPIRTVYHYNGPTVQAKQQSQKVAESLQSIPAFVPLNKEPQPLHNTSDGMLLQHFGAGEYIVKEGDEGHALYIIVSGQAKLLTTDLQGQEQDVLPLNIGEFFGEMALFSGETSPVSIAAVGDLEVMTLSLAVINQMIERQPSFAREIGQILEIRRRAIATIKQSNGR
ncbi:MAG: mechanosensitive ion channel family protein [Snowella sp.]|nr:mechanosensitive ion channel family protein [Snowella sp.]